MDLLRDAAERGIRYLDGLDARSVAVAQSAIGRLMELDVELPEEPTDPATVLALLDELAGVSLVVLQPLGLDVRPVVAAGLRPFVPLQPQPAQAAEDRLQRPRIVARPVGVLNAQNEHAIRVARVEPVEQRRADASDVRDAGGAGREADADGHRGIV